MGDGIMQGRVALVTGAASGLGAATAKLFAEEGAKRVFIGDVREEQLNETAHRLTQSGFDVEGIRLDVSDEASWSSALDHITASAGGLDALVNNAGLSGANPDNDALATDYWNKLLAVNLSGPFFGIRAAWPLLKESGEGSVVNVSSIGGVVGIKGIHPGYIASKGGLTNLTRGLALEMADDNIRVNSVHPGAMPAMNGAAWDADTEQGRAILKRVVPLARQAEHIEVAQAVLFLSSTRASYITGAALYADGGWLAQ